MGAHSCLGLWSRGQGRFTERTEDPQFLQHPGRTPHLPIRFPSDGHREAGLLGRCPVQLVEPHGALELALREGEPPSAGALPWTGLRQSRPQALRQHRLGPGQSASLWHRC